MDAEPVLLVDHHEGEIGERDIVLEQRVGADDQADLARREPVENGLARLALLAARENGDLLANSLGQLLHGREMLANEDLGRRHQRGLTA